MLNTIKRIVRDTPRASFSNPRVYFDKDENCVKVVAGSPADAVRFIGAIRSYGYTANLASPYESKVVSVSE